MRGRYVFLDSLRLHGSSRIFGNPGTTETPLLDTLREYPHIQYVTTLHEGIAVGAASYFAQASGETPVANMHVAPGLGNAIGMLYNALKAQSPLIATAGAQDTRMRLRNPLLGHDLVAMAAPVTKWSVQVEHADEMGPVMQRAFKIANEHPKGPVFVSLPINVMEQETGVDATCAGDLALADAASEDAIDRLASLLREARAVGIVAGDDVARCGATEVLIQLAGKLGAGVHTEMVSMHVSFPSDHPNFRGAVGPDHALARQMLDGYDLVLLLGGPFFEEMWYSEESPFGEGAKVCQIELGPGTLAANFPLTLGLTGHIRDALARLAGKMDNVAGASDRNQEFAAAKAAAAEAQAGRLKALWDRDPMTPARALYEVGSALPEGTVLVDESITGATDVARNFRRQAPHDSYGARGGGIGQGLAGAIGVAAARPHKQIVCVSGDGSAMYSIQALWTAAHLQQKILFIILANREYRILKHNVDQYRTRFDARSNNPYPYMDLARPILSFSHMAMSMGVPAATVSTPGEIAAVVAQAMETKGPFLLELIVKGLESIR